MTAVRNILIVGAGIFGVTAAIALRERGYQICLVDSGRIPHPLAASTDISKVLRIEYGADEMYATLSERSRERWLVWNHDLFGEDLYHDIGVTIFAQVPMEPGGYEYENYHTLKRRGHNPERVDSAAIARRFPAWKAETYVDGYFNTKGGYIESGRVVAALVEVAKMKGVIVQPDTQVMGFVEQHGRVTGVRTTHGELLAEHVIIAAGVWTLELLPELAGVLRSTGHPVFHLQPQDPELFAPPNFYVFSADSSRTGWYGFPTHPRAGVVKIAKHGPGLELNPSGDARVVSEINIAELRAFLATTFPALVEAPVVYTRRCMYCDTADEHFLIDRHPERAGLTIASGDSGHAFKFAPVLGDLVADVVEGHSNPYGERFRWRTFPSHKQGQEPSRFRGEAS